MAAFILALCRSVPFAAISPFGALRYLPTPARVALSMVLALAMLAVGGKAPPSSASMVTLGMSNMLLGFLASGAAFFLQAAIEVLGSTIDSAFGWTLVQTLIEPNGAPTLMGGLLSLLGTWMFLSSGALAFLAGSLVHSAVLWPLGRTLTIGPYPFSGLAAFGATALETGLEAALPIVLMTMVVSVLTGALARLAPQAQVLMIEFPLMTVLGVVLVLSALPTFPTLVGALEHGMEAAMAGMASQVW